MAQAISSSVPDSLIFWSWIFHLFRSPFDDDSFTLLFWIFHLILTLSSILTHPSYDPDSFIFLSWLIHPLILTLISFYPGSSNFWSWLFHLLHSSSDATSFIFSSWLFHTILTLHDSILDHSPFLLLTLSSFYPDLFTKSTVLIPSLSHSDPDYSLIWS